MTASTDTVWRCDDQRVIDRWRSLEAESAAFMDRLNAQLAEWGFTDYRVWYSDSAFGGTRHLLGVPLPDGVKYHDPKSWPEGWRVERDRGYLVPARSTKPGKAVAYIWDQLCREYPSPRKVLAEFGMPMYVLAGMTAHAPACVLRDDTLWVKWSIDPTDHSEKVDADVWQRVPLSEFYALVESGRDPWSVTV